MHGALLHRELQEGLAQKDVLSNVCTEQRWERAEPQEDASPLHGSTAFGQLTVRTFSSPEFHVQCCVDGIAAGSRDMQFRMDTAIAGRAASAPTDGNCVPGWDESVSKAAAWQREVWTSCCLKAPMVWLLCDQCTEGKALDAHIFN